MIIGYVGVGPAKFRHRAALLAAGVDEDQIYVGPAKLEDCLSAVAPGDTLAVWRVGQLGTDLRDRIQIVDRLMARGATLRVLAARRGDDDGALMSGVIVALADFKRDLDSERAKLVRKLPEAASARPL